MQLTIFDKKTENNIRHQIFIKSKLGQYYSSLPLEELSKLLKDRNKSSKGSKGWFSHQGKIALQFLKPYLKLSDEKLLERLNSDWTLQYFCGLSLGLNEQIKDKNIIWRTRKYVASYLDNLGISTFQDVLINNWDNDLSEAQIGMSDATCYESYIKYPTDVELIWDSVVWLKETINYLCKSFAIAQPRNKFKEQSKRHLVYMRRRRKLKKQQKKRIKQSLYLCNKLIGQLQEIIELAVKKQVTLSSRLEVLEEKNLVQILINDKLLERFRLIQKVYYQQYFHYENPKESVPNRIVSLFKPYLRPIVRGKTGKRVEFGAKVNTWQVDGINFIEHLSFDAFHEGIRLKQGIAFHTKHFGKPSQIAADKIYATNENRSHCSTLGIQTNFVPKGRRTQNLTKRKQEDTARQVLGKARATILEGAYGNDKNHYDLKKIKARNKLTEIAWIFFGMMAANAMKIIKKRKSKPPI